MSSEYQPTPRGRILLVEDDPDTARFIMQVLGARAGFHIEHASSPAAALPRIGPERWDLIITDIEMPDMTGIELLETLRRQAPALPVAVITAHVTVDNTLGALRGRADEFLQKPLRPDSLVAAVTGLISRGRGGGGAREVGSVCCFQSPSATVDFRPVRFIAIDDHMTAKLAAIGAFASQATVRQYLEPDLIEATARYWSRFGSGRYAEAFEVVRDHAASPAYGAAGPGAREAAAPEATAPEAAERAVAAQEAAGLQAAVQQNAPDEIAAEETLAAQQALAAQKTREVGHVTK
jgi:DNA-binding response OmpR family regulator